MRHIIPLTVLLMACGGTPVLPPDRSALPEPAGTVDWAPPTVTTWKMENGLEVWFLRQKQAPLVSLRLVTSRGASTDPAGKAGLTALAVDMLDEGAGGKSALELADAWQRLATDYGASASTDGVTFSLDMLADNLDPSLALLADVLMRSAFPADEFARRKQQRIAGALAREANPMQAMFVNIRRALFAEGYGGFPAGGLRTTLAGLTLDETKAQAAAVVKPGGAGVIVVGDVERDALEASLNTALGEWKGAPSATAGSLSEQEPQRAIYLVDFPGLSQSAIAVARRSPGTGAADAIAATVFNWALGGAFTSRLNMNLREDKGWTYGARASFNRWQAAGMYLMYAKVKADKTRVSLDEMFGELAAMQGPKPTTAEEREKAVGGLLQGFPAKFERMSSVAGRIATLRLDARPVDYYSTWTAKVDAVTLEIARATAKKYTVGDDFLVVIAGDRKTVEPTLEGLGLSVIVCDAQGNRIPDPPTEPPDQAK